VIHASRDERSCAPGASYGRCRERAGAWRTEDRRRLDTRLATVAAVLAGAGRVPQPARREAVPSFGGGASRLSGTS
jgi:hypothetical protein